MSVTIKLDPRALAQVLRGQDGPVIRHTSEVTTRIQERAKSKVGVSKEEGSGPFPHLRDAIVKRFAQDADGFYLQLVAQVPHALMHHEGTEPHEIVPRDAKVLRFVIGGTVIFTTHVDHPGTDPNPYFTDAAAEEGLKVTGGVHG